MKDQITKVNYQPNLTLHGVNTQQALWKHCLDVLQYTWNIPHRDPPIFPGPQPISIERRHFNKLRLNEYLVCEKTDGIRHVLLCTKWNDNKVAVIINRALEMYIVKNKFNPQVYNNTVIDLELIRTPDKWIGLMYDAVFFKGEDVKNKTLTERLTYCDAIEKAVRKVKTDAISFISKPMYTKDDFDKVLQGTKGHKTDGLIFTPVKESIRIGTHNTMFKWKPRDKNTIDFLVKRSNNLINLFVQERGKLMFESQIEAKNLSQEWNSKLIDDVIVECQFDNGNPIPLLIRTDKHHPNNRKTFYRTLTNIAENIQMDEFKKLFKTFTDAIYTNELS